jgi:Rrf2 family protein
MKHIVHVSDAASLAMHSMVFIASAKRVISTGDISGRLGVSEFHLSKVLQRLAKNSLVKSFRGPRGGFTLARNENSISLLDVYEAIEGPMRDASCLLDKRACNDGACILGDTIHTVSAMFKNHLRKTRISDLAHIFQAGETG